MSAGACWWHQGPAEDVEVVVVVERGSGPPATLAICLPCAEGVARGRGGYGPAARDALTSLQERAAQHPLAERDMIA